jgi:hypothetical protein
MGGDGCGRDVAACTKPPESCREATPLTGHAKAAGNDAANMAPCCKGVCGLLLTSARAVTDVGHVCYTTLPGP